MRTRPRLCQRRPRGVDEPGGANSRNTASAISLVMRMPKCTLQARRRSSGPTRRFLSKKWYKRRNMSCPWARKSGAGYGRAQRPALSLVTHLADARADLLLHQGQHLLCVRRERAERGRVLVRWLLKRV